MRVDPGFGWKQADCCLLAYECSHLLHLPGAQPAATICITVIVTKLRGLIVLCVLFVMSVVIPVMSQSFFPIALLPKFQAFDVLLIVSPSLVISLHFYGFNLSSHTDTSPFLSISSPTSF